MLETLRDASRQPLPRVSTAAPPRLVNVDLGQSNDYTAITILTPAGWPEPIYDLGHIERVPLNTRYTTIVQHVVGLANALRVPVAPAPEPVRLSAGNYLTAPAPRSDVYLLLDYTGVGRPVLDMFMDAKEPAPGLVALDQDVIIVPITITGGNDVSRSDSGLHIPKKELASVVQRVLQEGRLQIDQGQPDAQALAEELAAFRAVINASGHVSFRAAEDWRAGNPGNHDDLVLSLALGIWYGEHALSTG